MTLASGTRLGPYEVLAPLGSGGMGEVYRARDERLDRDVALKVLPASYSSDADRLRRFEQEARAAGRLNHPNVLAIYDVGAADGAPYVVSELLEGGTLRERLASGTIPIRKAVDYALQLARGLGAAHEKGIVHRDLKPENVFVTGDGRVKILDFGLAKLTRPESSEQLSAAPTETRGTEPGVVLGTVGYMAPEQVRGQNADARADIFAFGAILYEMLSGQRAFRGNSSADVMSAILKEEPPPLSDTGRSVSPVLERLVAHCLEKNPEERFQSARDIAYELETVSSLSGPAPELERGRLAVRPRRLRVPIAIGLALIAAAGGILIGRATRAGTTRPPLFHQLTYRHGSIGSARFAPDGQSVVYSARWDGAPARLFLKRPDTADSFALDLPPAEVRAISPSGVMSLILACVDTHAGACAGTLAQAPLSGGAPRLIREGVQEVDLAPDGSGMSLVRDVAEGAELEYPAGKVLYKTGAHLSFARISPRGDRIAFVDHPERLDDAGSIAVVDLNGRKTILAGPFTSAQGIAWTPDGREIWFTASTGTGRTLYAVSMSGKRRAIATAPGNLTIRDISKNGSVLVTHDSEVLSSWVSGPDGRDRDLSWLNWTIPLDLSEDGKTALIEEEGGDGAYMAGLRPTDGSPVVRLTAGSAGGLSYDGKWVLARPDAGKGDVLIPTGPGDPVPLPPSNVRRLLSASWSPDGKRIVISGTEPGHGVRLYVRDIPRGAPRPITPEGFILWGMTRAVSPDGRLVLAGAVADGSTWIFPIDGGAPRRLDAISARSERPIRWTEDGRGVYVREFQVLPYEIFRLDLETGRREPWRRIAAADPAGAEGAPPAHLSADGRTCLYTLTRKLSTLYILEGLR